MTKITLTDEDINSIIVKESYMLLCELVNYNKFIKVTTIDNPNSDSPDINIIFLNVDHIIYFESYKY